MNSGPRRFQRSRPGFTLLELMIVLVIGGIIVTIAAPRVNLNMYRLNSAYQTVAMTMMSAQRLAIRRQHQMVVTFDTVRDRIRVHEDRNNNFVIDAGEPINFTQLEEGVVFGRGVTPARPLGGPLPVTFAKQQTSLPAVTFTRSGSASEFGVFYLTSTRTATGGNFPEDTRAFEVERATGRTTVFRYQSATARWIRSF